MIIIGDADDTYDFCDIPKLLVPIEGGAEMAMVALVCGIQVIFSSVFISMMLLEEDE